MQTLEKCLRDTSGTVIPVFRQQKSELSAENFIKETLRLQVGATERKW
jgi:hypothetical protein